MLAIKALKAEKTVCTKGTHGQIAAIRMRIEVLMINTFQVKLFVLIQRFLNTADFWAKRNRITYLKKQTIILFRAY